uniref:Ig-like domain-containing protein n=1 Tax=Electrophorus electricus TaxID=8005 RepID=A0AAY5EXV4_ELEEL
MQSFTRTHTRTTYLLLSTLSIQQSPPHVLQRPDQREAKLGCSHGDSNYPYMYWYQQKSGSLMLIGMLHYERAAPEDNFKARFDITGHSKSKAFLVISNITSLDSGVYFCAASRHSHTPPISPHQKLYILPTWLMSQKTKWQSQKTY